MTCRSPVLLLALLAACDPSAEKVQALEERITALETKLEQAETDDVQGKAMAALTKRVEALESAVDGVGKTQNTAATNLDNLAERVDSLETRTKTLEEAGSATPEVVEETVVEEAEIGVKECDDYIAMYRKCIDDKMPESVRETSKKALEMSVDAWKQAAGTAAGRAGLAEACKAAREAVERTCS